MSHELNEITNRPLLIIEPEYEWEWYEGVVGCYFLSHPQQQEATIHVEDRTHPSTKHLPEEWIRFDEWYDFRTNPREKVQVLASLDETTYEGGKMGDDHPVVWAHMPSGSRAWYTALGHTKESFQEPFFLEHLLGGIEWAAGVTE